MALFKNDLKGLSPSRALLVGSFGYNGAQIRGKRFTVAKGATGTFKMSLLDNFSGLDSAMVSLQLNAADDKHCVLGPWNSTDQTLTFYIWDKVNGALADIANHANNRINFVLILRNAEVA